MKVKIPVHLVPRAYVDYDMEQRQILRQDYVLPDGTRIPPLTAGRLMALELVASEFFLHPRSCTQLDIAAALVLLTCERNLVQDLTVSVSEPSASVDSAARTGDNSSAGSACCPPGMRAFPKLYAAASSFLNAHGDAIVADYPALVRWCIDVPFYGYDMLPKGGGSAPKECWFDGEFAGSVLAPAAKLLATPFEMILWDTPLCTVWHALAQQAAAFGVKGIERPPDAAVLKAMMAEAAARESRGELHPWQYDDPVSYDLTAEQFKRNPNLAQLFARMRADYEKGGHKPLDPADYPIPRAGAEPGTAGETLSPPAPDLSGFGPVITITSSASEAERTLTVEEHPHHGI